MLQAQQPRPERPPRAAGRREQVKHRHLYRGGGPGPDLGDRADNAAADEISPRGGDEMAGRQLTEDVVYETATFRGPRDRVAPGKPRARMTCHGGTITLPPSASAMKITLPGLFLEMMRGWPMPRVPAATTWWLSRAGLKARPPRTSAPRSRPQPS